MMKNGEIIDKGKSLDLINSHGRKNLEEVFLKIVRGEKWSFTEFMHSISVTFT